MQIAESLSLEVSMCMENIHRSQADLFHPCNFMILCMIWGEILVSHHTTDMTRLEVLVSCDYTKILAIQRKTKDQTNEGTG